MIIAKIIGVPKAIQNLQTKGNKTMMTVSEAIERTSILVKNRSMSAYLRGPRPTHLAVVTGNLIKSIRNWKEYDAIKGELTGKVGTNVIYGKIWELGRKGDKRPFLKPALTDLKPAILNMLKVAVNKGVKS